MENEAQQRRGLKNYKRVEALYDGEKFWKLMGQNGPVEAYESFSKELVDDGVPYETRKAYLLAVSQFLDYACEAEVFEATITKNKLNKAIGNYRKFLCQASQSPNREIRKIAHNLDRLIPLSTSSVIVHLSAVQRFLDHADRYAEEKITLLSVKHGKEISHDEYSSVIDAINKYEKVNERERKHLRETLIGGLIRNASRSWKEKTKSLAVNINKNTTTLDECWEFPLHKIADLLDATKSKRDKVIYTLSCGGGLRISEITGLRWENIDLVGRKIYIKDPRRQQRLLLDNKDKIRFKGRNVSRVFMFYPFGDLLFEYLEDYVNSSEYLATETHGYVFQISKGLNKGKPYKNSDDSTRWRNFKTACKRIDGLELRPDGKLWHPHSLRDSYGVFLKNYFPHTDGSEGLNRETVQICMGHKDPKATDVYARDKIEKVDELLTRYEILMSGDKAKVKKLKELDIERQTKKLAELLGVKESQLVIGHSDD